MLTDIREVLKRTTRIVLGCIERWMGVGVKQDDEKSPKNSLGEVMKKFWQELFLLNAEIDIKIDEEEAPYAIGQSIIENICSKKIFTKDLSISEKDLQSLFDHAKKLFQPNEPIDIGTADIQGAWLESPLNGTDGLSASISLLFLGKFCRSLYLSLTQKQTGKTTIDFLSHFLAANINVSIDKDNVLRPIQVLLYMECAACAPPEASLGFLKMAETVPGSKNIQAIFPGYRALRNYNKAVALNHLERRDEALTAISIAFDEIMRSQEPPTKDLEVWREYLHTPVLLIWADILQRMQFGKNSMDILSKIDVVAEEQHDLTPYKKAKKGIYEALAWVDVGDLERCEGVIKGLLDSTESKIIFGENIFLLLKDIVNKKSKYDLDFSKLVEELSERQKIRYDALLVFIEYSVFRNGKSLKLKKTKGTLKDIEHILNVIENMVEYYRADRGTRHNLKEFAIECLGHLEKVAKKPFRDADLENFEVESWTRCLEQCLKCIEIPCDEEKGVEKESYQKEGSIANEFWGEDFKKLKPGLRDSVFDSTSDLVDMLISYRIKMCESYFSENEKKRHCKNSDDKGCIENSPQDTFNFKDTLKRLVQFELDAMGLKIDKTHNGNVAIRQGMGTLKKGNKREDYDYVYPREGSYWDRIILRRGSYLARVEGELLEKNPGQNDKGCPAELKNRFSWLEDELKEPDDKKVRECLEQVINRWRENPSEQHLTHGPQKVPTLEIDDYESIVRERDYLARLEGGRTKHPVGTWDVDVKGGSVGGIEFVSLRRWNSFTPELTFSRGGGYYVFVPDDGPKKSSYGGTYRKTKLGVVIDPGFDFIHNFFTQGFALDDIDIVLLTHAHHDHIDDFQGIADLLMESSKRGNRKEPKKIYAFMPLDSYSLVKRFIHEHAFRRFYNDTVIVDMNRLLPIPKDQTYKLEPYDLVFVETEGKLRFLTEDADKNKGPCINIQPIMASHNDYVTHDPSCVGYVLKFENEGKAIATLGFTGDSQWFPEYAGHFQDCELVCSHMGSVLGDDNPKEYSKEKISHGAWESLIREKNHPYLPGEILFLAQLSEQKPNKVSGDSDKVCSERVVVLSEFGEEMKGLMRVDLAHRFNTCISKGDWSRFVNQDKIENGANKCNSMHVEPADIGLRIALRSEYPPLAHCAICDNYIELKRLVIEAYGNEEALFFVCGPCFRSRTHDVRSTKYESILEFGRVLRRELSPDLDDGDSKKDS